MSAPAHGRSSEPTPHVLLAGQSITTGTPHNKLVNGEFELDPSLSGLTIEQTLSLTGSRGIEYVLTDSWRTAKLHARGIAPVSLTMRRTGNLVLTNANGETMWSTGTGGTGTGNKLVLDARGKASVVTSAGKVVWTTQSGPVFLGAGGVLASGQRMVDGYSGANEKGVLRGRLTMQAGGNLVRSCGTHVLWQSHTHVRGSTMTLRNDGDLLITSPSGRTVWSSHSGGHSTYVFLDMVDMRIEQVIPEHKTIWQRFWKRQC
jgi:hypothetical protein